MLRPLRLPPLLLKERLLPATVMANGVVGVSQARLHTKGELSKVDRKGPAGALSF